MRIFILAWKVQEVDSNDTASLVCGLLQKPHQLHAYVGRGLRRLGVGEVGILGCIVSTIAVQVGGAAEKSTRVPPALLMTGVLPGARKETRKAPYAHCTATLDPRCI